MEGEDRSKMSWHSQSLEDIYKNLDSSVEGLSDADASERLKTYGLNEIVKKKKNSILRMLWQQIKDPMIIILVAASVLSFILNEIIEGSVILFIIIINSIISIVQEKKAESAIESLKKMSAGHATVLRQGEISKILSNQLVIGDIVYLEDGDMIPADIRLIEITNLKIQESSLTGESLPVEKDESIVLNSTCDLGDRINMAYSSTFVTYGRGFGIVTSTGMDTEVGKIAHLLNEQSELQTPLKRKLSSVGKILTLVGIIICIIIFAIGLLYEQPLMPLLMTAISLAISIIPEGLPATATIVLALGVQRMAKKNAIIRKLPAVETLGSASVICTDKTGTLTQNKMTVTEIAIHFIHATDEAKSIEQAMKNKLDYKDLIYACALCNNAEFDPDNPGKIIGDPTEGALLSLSEVFKVNHDDLEEVYPRVYEQPFDSIRKRMSTVNIVDNKNIVYTKGAIDEILPICQKINTSHGVQDLTDEHINNIKVIAEKMAGKALRVLAFARKEISEAPIDDDADLENNLIFIGLVGMIDPPRQEVKSAVETCHKCGIRTVMITGDHRLTAWAIAKELKIWREGEDIYTGSELDELSDEKFNEIVKNTTVYARVTPEQKLRIVQALQKNGKIVAMTGDGVNDSPALKTADIGIAMGLSGTEVAKEASDMIITDDNFATIVEAVKEGRRVYRNIQKVIQFLLAGNISEVLVILIATIFNFPAPLLAIHILWVNLATDTLPALALGVDPAEKDIMKRKPLKTKTLFEKDLIIRVLLQGSFIALATFIAFFIGYQDDIASGQAMAFCTIAFSQLFYSYSQKSNTKSIFSRGFFENKYLLGSILISAGLMFLLLVFPFMRSAFELSSLELREWVFIIALSLIPTLLIELTKLISALIRRAKKNL